MIDLVLPLEHSSYSSLIQTPPQLVHDLHMNTLISHHSLIFPLEQQYLVQPQCCPYHRFAINNGQKLVKFLTAVMDHIHFELIQLRF